jgi:cell division protein FtsZ
MELAFQLADDALRQAVQGITELVTEAGVINIDFAHIRRLILLGGGALMSIGQGQGENKARQAVEQALHHPLLDSVDLSSAAGVIANFTGGSDLTLFEVQEALSSLQSMTGDNAEIFFGLINDERMDGRAQVILMITGLGAPTLDDAFPGLKPAAKPAPVEPAHRPEPAFAAPAPRQVEPAQPFEASRPTYSPMSQPRPADYPPAGHASTARPAVGFGPDARPSGPRSELGHSGSSPRTLNLTANLSPTNLDIPAFLRRR